jgi:hypothetical protein
VVGLVALTWNASIDERGTTTSDGTAQLTRARDVVAQPVPAVTFQALAGDCVCRLAVDRKERPIHNHCSASVAVPSIRTHDDVAETVVVDVACTTHRIAAVLVFEVSTDGEAVLAIQCRELHHCRPCTAMSKHNVAPPCICDRGAQIPQMRTDDDVTDAITVHITGTSHWPSAVIISCFAKQLEAIRAIKERAVGVDG